MSTILETRGLTHIYGAGTPFERKALDHVDLKIEKGEILGVIGHTGSGKSTLIQHFNGLLKPDEGEVLLDGQSIWNEKGKCARETRFRVGLVFQYPEYQLFEETIAKDIAFGPTNMGLPQAEIDERVLESMRAVGLDENYGEPVAVCAVGRPEAPRRHRGHPRHAARRACARRAHRGP